MERGGQPGNDNATKNRPWKDQLRRALARRGNGDWEKGLALVADKVVEDAIAGDKDAWMEIGNRSDGKSAQQVQLTGADDGPVQFTQVIRKVIGA